MDKKQIEELRQIYIKKSPEDMTAKLVKQMTDSDLLDMHYFLMEDDDLDDGFYVFLACFGFLYLFSAILVKLMVSQDRTFLIHKIKLS